MAVSFDSIFELTTIILKAGGRTKARWALGFTSGQAMRTASHWAGWVCWSVSNISSSIRESFIQAIYWCSSGLPWFTRPLKSINSTELTIKLTGRNNMTGEWGKGGGGEAYVDLTSQTRGTKISLSYFRIQKPAGLIGSKQSWASKKKICF